jgi:osmotically-inducible protein OsmY
MQHSDDQIRREVEEELRYDPSLAEDDIAVSVREGVVTLAGTVKSYLDKWRAERTVSRVRGVRAIANDLDVRLPSSSTRPDSDIARAVADALDWNIAVPRGRIKARVENGWVTLEGDVDWNFQKEAAEHTVRSITGVKGVTSLVTVHARPTPADVKKKIADALDRGAAVDAERITVEVEGNKAILRGTVRSFAERRDAERAAMNAPGITEVENRLVVDPNVPAVV